ncbi:MAG: hypothetical protein JWQ11_1816 [Rhizobacter sp.]|nr:hypothetical protein [Rhizobacter sp.]
MRTVKPSLLNALASIVSAVEATRNLQVLTLLLGVFATAGLLVAMTEASLARDALAWAIPEGAAAIMVAFYGASAAGLMLMDEARGGTSRDIEEAIGDSLAIGHRLVGVFLIVAVACAGLLAVIVGLLWLCKLPLVGVVLFGAVTPVTVVGAGLAALALAAVVVPMTAPAIWSGRSPLSTVRQLAGFVRYRLPTAALLMGAVSLLTAGVAAIVTFVVVSGGRLVSQAAVVVLGIDVPPEQLMAGLFGHGLRSLGAAGAPVDATGYTAAALTGGGVVFALALVLPGLVYLRGACTVYLALSDTQDDPRPGSSED